MRHHRLFLIVLGAYLTLGLYYAFQTPFFFKPDEQYHLAYVRYLTHIGSLPQRNPELALFQIENLADPEAHQPPLYYWLASLVTRGADTDPEEPIYEPNPFRLGTEIGNETAAVPVRGRHPLDPLSRIIYGARLVSMAFGALALVGLYMAGLQFLSPQVAALGVALLAFNPQFLYISTSVSNDVPGAALVNLVWWPLLHALRHPGRIYRPLLVGAGIGLATLGKVSGVGMLGIWLVATLANPRKERSWRWPAVFALGTALALALPAPWFAHNLARYGDPFGLGAVFSYMGWRAVWPPLAKVGEFLDFVWHSYWLDFSAAGWNFAEPLAYQLLGIVVVAGLVGVIAGLIRKKLSRLPVALLALWFLVVAGSFFWASLQTTAFMGGGRLLFPAAISITLLLAVGLDQVARWLGRGRLAWGVALGLAFWAAIAPTRYVPSIYQALPLVPDMPPAARQVSARLGESIELAGYTLASQSPLTPGERLQVTLYWRALAPIDKNYSVFVHLDDLQREILSQTDTYPGYGTFPTRQWQPGDLVEDPYWLRIPAQGDYPQLYRLSSGLYYLPSMKRLPVTYPNGYRPPDNSIDLGPVAVVPTDAGEVPPASRRATPARFGEAITLVGARLEFKEAGSLKVSTYWQAETQVERDYTIFLHAYGENGKLAAQVDSQPRQGRFPTSQWQPGEVVEDQSQLWLTPGAYALALGLYEPTTMARLPAYDDGRRFPSDAVPLGSVTVPQE